jgi:sulfur-oxidizing protein SoxB
MNLTTREFMQLLGAGTMAGMGLGTYAEAQASVASSGLYDIGKFGSVSFSNLFIFASLASTWALAA